MDIEKGLKDFSDKNYSRFFMPGHKGRAFEGCRGFEEFYKTDVTELPETDSLFLPESYIKTASEKLRKIFKSSESIYLTNGSTGGVMAMIYGSFEEGDRVIVDKNCHTSVINAINLKRLEPLYIYGENLEEFGIYGEISAENIEEIFKKNEKIKGVILTSPNYFGICHNIAEISGVCKKNNALLLVDEAHGAHFYFSRHLPETSMEQGADACNVSLHKTLPCPNQTAVLNIRNQSLISRIKDALMFFHTTSPSYPLLAMADSAVQHLYGDTSKIDRFILKLKKRIGETRLEKVKLLDADDVAKITVNVSALGTNARECQKLLKEKFGLICEMRFGDNLLFMTSFMNTDEEIDRLFEGIHYLEEN